MEIVDEIDEGGIVILARPDISDVVEVHSGIVPQRGWLEAAPVRKLQWRKTRKNLCYTLTMKSESTVETEFETWLEQVNEILIRDFGTSRLDLNLTSLEVSFVRYYSNGLSPEDAAAQAVEDAGIQPVEDEQRA